MSSHTQCMTSTGDNHSRIFVKNHWGTWSHAPINCCLLICWCCSADGRFVRNLLSWDYEGIHILLSTVMKDKSNWWQCWGIVTCMKNAMAWFSRIEWIKECCNLWKFQLRKILDDISIIASVHKCAWSLICR